jgi:hypothetical protein
MAGRTHLRVVFALGALSLAAACEEEKKPEPAATSEAVSTASAPPPPAPAPAPEASAQEPEEVPVPAWVDDYAAALCKRVAVCREKMLGAVGPEQKMMLSMQIPTQEACVKNTRTFKNKPPKAELDPKEQKALASCIRSVPTTACGNVQTGKVPECEAIIEILAAAKAGPAAPSP